MQSRIPYIRQGKLVLLRPCRRVNTQRLERPISFPYFSTRYCKYQTSALLPRQDDEPADVANNDSYGLRKFEDADAQPNSSESSKLYSADLKRNYMIGPLSEVLQGSRLLPEGILAQKVAKNPPMFAVHTAFKWSPTKALALYLDLEHVAERETFARRVVSDSGPKHLPTILLAYMNVCAISENTSKDHAVENVLENSLTYLKQKGFGFDDVERWAWILSGISPDDQVQRYCAHPYNIPRFVLLEILRKDFRHVTSLQNVLALLLSGMEHVRSTQHLGNGVHKQILLEEAEDGMFDAFVTRLLSQARNIWPAAVVSIVYLAERRLENMRSLLDNNSSKPQLLQRVTRLTNRLMALLSIPAKVNPMTNMRHVWTAQRRILEIASSFEPPLLLSQSSYQAVVSTLIASRKSELESKSAVLRTKSWPPWRRDQDGMDARRSADEDISRVLSALSKMQEAGFRTDASDEAARIHGGMEADGTPTIQTRRVWRRSRSKSFNLEMSSQAWASRIEATRDVQEAWGAFLEYKRRGGSPSQTMYFAMFEKINYHNANMGGAQRGDFMPGDGKEVMTLSNESFTKYYIERHQAPPLPILYAEMLHNGIRPSGRCLAFLVSKARTSDEGIGYLRDSDIDKAVLERLRDPTLSAGRENFIMIPEKVLCAYIELICRLASKATTVASQQHLARNTSRGTVDTHELHNDQDQVSVRQQRQQRQRKGRHALSRETLAHVRYLLQSSSTTHRPAWYAYFRALASEGAIIPRTVIGGKTSKWDSVTWNRMVGALSGFHATGLELDPQGFIYLCMGFEKFAKEPRVKDLPLRQLGPVRSVDRSEIFSNGIKLIKDEFLKLSSTPSTSEYMPKLRHTIRGVHLHAYVRALGAIEDHQAIMDAVGWMVKNNQALEEIADETRNGFSSFRKTLIAIRHFLHGTHYEQEADQLVDKVEWWGRWPTASEVDMYLRSGQENLEANQDGVEENGYLNLEKHHWLE